MQDGLTLACLAVLAAGMAAWSWRTWPDPLIDFGREAYVAWRLAHGAVLHRDVVYLSGPLSPYWNALVFRLVGASLDTLFAVNAVIFAALVIVWLALLRRVADRTAAFAGGALFVLLFGFAEYVGIGNYNYLAPYSHELPHGLLLASLGFLSASRGRWGLAGFLLGLVALTKIEVFAAAAAANALGLVALAWRDPKRAGWRRVGRFAAGFALPIALAVAAFAIPLSPGEAVRAVAISWLRVLGNDVAAQPFYQRGLGADDLPGNLARAAGWALGIAALFAPAAAASFALRRGRLGRLGRRGLALAAGAGMALATGPFVAQIAWLQAARPLPFLGLGAMAVCGLRLFRAAAGAQGDSPDRSREGSRSLLQAMLVTFATVLLAKIFFRARIYHYGFALALPATLLFVAALVSWIPGAIDRRGGCGAVFRGAALGVLTVAVVGHGLAMAPYFAVKSGWMGGPHDRFRVPPGIARVFGTVLADVEARTRPDDSLLVLPEGVMLNFLARRRTPTPHFSFNPFEVYVYGESEMLHALQATPPRVVVLVHQDMSEHGARFLGHDYGRDLLAWIRSAYRTRRQLGGPPLEPDTRFGVAILEPARGGGEPR